MTLLELAGTMEHGGICCIGHPRGAHASGKCSTSSCVHCDRCQLEKWARESMATLSGFAERHRNDASVDSNPITQARRRGMADAFDLARELVGDDHERA